MGYRMGSRQGVHGERYFTNTTRRRLTRLPVREWRAPARCRPGPLSTVRARSSGNLGLASWGSTLVFVRTACDGTRARVPVTVRIR